MFGIAVIGIFLIYLLISAAIVRWAVRAAKARNKNPKLWGGIAALVMYLLVFWDHIPTLVMHKYYCEKEAGFWVYKTPEQWVKENPGVMEGLVNKNLAEKDEYPEWPEEVWMEKKVSQVNQRIAIYYADHLSTSDEKELFLHVWRWKTELLDKQTGEVIARQIDFSSGDGRIGGESPRKFWLQSDHCSAGVAGREKFYELLKRFKGERK